MGDGNKISPFIFQKQIYSKKIIGMISGGPLFQKPIGDAYYEDTYECREVPDKVLTLVLLDLGSKQKSERIKAAKTLRGEPGLKCFLRVMKYEDKVSIALKLLEDLDPNGFEKVILSAALRDQALANLVDQYPEVLGLENNISHLMMEMDKDALAFDPSSHFLALVRVLAFMRGDERGRGLSDLFLEQLAEMKETLRNAAQFAIREIEEAAL